MSDYFSYTALADGNTARASLWNVIFAAIEDGFDMLPTEAEFKLGLTRYGVDSGAADAHVVTLSYVPSAYTDGMEVRFKAAATNTGAATVNVNSLGIKTITRQSGATLEAADILVGKMVHLVYNSTSEKFELQNVFADVAIQAALTTVAALSASSSVPVSATDASAGYASAKILDGNGVAFSVWSPGGNEKLIIPATFSEVAKTADYTVTALNMRSNIVFTNTGASAEVILSLPAGGTGYGFMASVEAAQYLRIKANGTETLSYLGTATAAGGYIRCNIIGGFVLGKWINSKWNILTMQETWRYDQ